LKLLKKESHDTMKLILYKLRLKGPIHLGEREGWLEGGNTFIHSDTLFSGFCHAFYLLFGETEVKGLIKRFNNDDPDFIVSSAFPYWQGALYFPVPKNQLSTNKEILKIEFIEKAAFERLMNGEKLEKIIGSFKTIPQKGVQRYPWSLENIPRIGLSRLHNHPGDMFFHFGQVWYKADAGLFFLVKYLNNEFQPKFEASLRLLADEGIGGDRSSGKGLFIMETPFEMEITVPTDFNGIISLSLYYPKDQSETVGIKDGFYDLIERKGYIYSPYGSSLRRRSIRMFAEGSVFSKAPERKGKLVPVKPAKFIHHEVYRCGYLLTLPYAMESK
jgi:CRISPR-associated protein Csm4